MRWLDSITIGWTPEFEQAPGVGDGQGNLACGSPWGRKEWTTTERTNLKSGKRCGAGWGMRDHRTAPAPSLECGQRVVSVHALTWSIPARHPSADQSF